MPIVIPRGKKHCRGNYEMETASKGDEKSLNFLDHKMELKWKCYSFARTKLKKTDKIQGQNV